MHLQESERFVKNGKFVNFTNLMLTISYIRYIYWNLPCLYTRFDWHRWACNFALLIAVWPKHVTSVSKRNIEIFFGHFRNKPTFISTLQAWKSRWPPLIEFETCWNVKWTPILVQRHSCNQFEWIRELIWTKT